MTAILGGLIILGGAGAVVLTLRKIAREPAVERPAPPVPEPASPEARAAAVLDGCIAFINAPSLEQMAAMTAGGDATLPLLTEHYIARRVALPKRVINPAVSAVEMNGRELMVVRFVNEAGRVIAAPFEWINGRYLLHWEAMVAYGDIPFPQFLSQHADGSFRVKVLLLAPIEEQPVPGDPNQVLVWLRHPDYQDASSFTVRRDSSTYTAISALPRGEELPVSLTVRWHQPEDHHPAISSFEHLHWIR